MLSTAHSTKGSNHMDNPVIGRIHSVETFGAVDGPGIRYVVFFQGCRLRCLYCHNPDSWDPEGGNKTSVKALMEDISKYKNFIRRGGVTLSGGEPLMQPEFAVALLNACRQQGLHTALDTAGSVPLAFSKEVIDAADMLLLDIKTYDDALSMELTGRESTLEHAMHTLEYCEQVHKPVWIRHVIVPGYTLVTERLEKLAHYLRQFQCIERVDLLPFHKMGEYKWQELGEYYALLHTSEPTPDEVKDAVEIFRRYGLHVHA